MKDAASLGLKACVLVMLICGGMTTVAQSQIPEDKQSVLPDYWERDSKPISVVAPNGRLRLLVVGRKTGRLYPDSSWEPEYYLEKDGERLSPTVRVYSNPRALWSPSSQFLAITSTDGGLVGNWKVEVYSVTGKHAVKHTVMNRVQLDIARRFPAGINPEGAHFFTDKERRGFSREVSWVNVVAVRWLTGPERLLVEGSVPPSSSYGANLGQCRKYVINPLTGEILESYADKESSRK
jgi:hypothetical protein